MKLTLNNSIKFAERENFYVLRKKTRKTGYKYKILYGHFYDNNDIFICQYVNDNGDKFINQVANDYYRVPCQELVTDVNYKEIYKFQTFDEIYKFYTDVRMNKIEVS